MYILLRHPLRFTDPKDPNSFRNLGANTPVQVVDNKQGMLTVMVDGLYAQVAMVLTKLLRRD